MKIASSGPFKRRSVLWSILTALLVLHSAVAQVEDLSILNRWVEWSDSKTMLQRHLNALAFKRLAEREATVKKLRTAADWKQRQKEVRSTLTKVLGPFPERTPLNARVLGTVKKDGYRIEKIVFESMPKFYVTNCLFIPDNLKEKNPAILNVIGHTDVAFRAASYQELILNLVKKGFIVLAMDPIGQGERLQYYDPAVRRSVVGGPTTEHSYFGKQCFISGSSAARYFAWDGIRALDYLVSRPEVDPERIGVTGISGGGTQTSYIAALDDRVAAAAPTCYICGFQRLLESIGPQDAEQNFNRGLAHRIDHADFLEVRAPKPTLVVATTRDFFSIQGARETVAAARRAFQALGAADHLALVEDDYGHGYTKKNREAIYAFFQKHLKNPGRSDDEKVELLTAEDLTVTQTGQLIDSLGGETVFSLNQTEARRLVGRLEAARKDIATHLPRVRTEAAKLSGYLPPEKASGLVFRGRHQRPGYFVEMYVMSGEGGCRIPFLLLRPDQAAKPAAMLYLHPGGKSAAAAPGAEMEWFVKQGYAVLSPDLSGTGEMGVVNDSTAFLALQIGRSIAGIRAADIVRCVQYLKTRGDIDSRDIVAIARGGMSVPLLHAAAFDRAITRVALIEPLVSFRSVVMSRYYNVAFADTVPNALTAYDLPDLAACLAPRRLMIVNAQDHLLTRANQPLIDRDLGFVRSVYARAEGPSNLAIKEWESSEPIEAVFLPWLKE